MQIQEARQALLFQLYHLYDDREADAIAERVMEKVTGWGKLDRVLNKQVPLSLLQEQELQKYQEELLRHRPLQYVLGEAWFRDLPFFVDERVLIPRPETEELVSWILDLFPGYREALTVTDVGTGSGVIPITLKKTHPEWRVVACDTSPAALEVAQINAERLGTPIEWLCFDFLDKSTWVQFPITDLLVSNPPYVPYSDACSMETHVLQYEPHLALFVENDDPLIFYRSLAEFSVTHVREYGCLACETHAEKAEAVATLWSAYGITDITIRKDMQGTERMVMGWKGRRPA